MISIIWPACPKLANIQRCIQRPILLETQIDIPNHTTSAGNYSRRFHFVLAMCSMQAARSVYLVGAIFTELLWEIKATMQLEQIRQGGGFPPLRNLPQLTHLHRRRK